MSGQHFAFTNNNVVLKKLRSSRNPASTCPDGDRVHIAPSNYVRRQIMITFQDDPIGPMTSKFFGEDNYMWASDFPHTDCTWPNSRNVIERDFAGVSDAVRENIVCKNAARTYGIALKN